MDYYLFRLGFDVPNGQPDDEAAPRLPFVFDELDGFKWAGQPILTLSLEWMCSAPVI